MIFMYINDFFIDGANVQLFYMVTYKFYSDVKKQRLRVTCSRLEDCSSKKGHALFILLWVHFELNLCTS
jgi:hypothetical protein